MKQPKPRMNNDDSSIVTLKSKENAGAPAARNRFASHSDVKRKEVFK